MKPYKLKHIPTGLYYQPYKYRGSNLSFKGKIYQTATHGLSSAFRHKEKYGDSNFIVQCELDSRIYKETKNILAWKETSRKVMTAITLLDDWEKEELILNN